MSGIKPEGSILYDITTISAYSSLPIFEYGYAKDHADLLHLNLSIVMMKRCFLPVEFETFSGSIPDVVTLGRMVAGHGL